MVDSRETRRAFVCGHPIKHSRSPLIHGHWLKQFGIDGDYGRQPVEPDKAEAFFAGFVDSGLIGGSDTKLKAAMDAGISVIVIDKPKAKLDGAVVFSTVEGVLNYMEEHYGFHQEP